MKWLFAVLVALNIIVFGGMVFSRMVVAPQQPMQAAAPAASPQPTVVQIHTNAPTPSDNTIANNNARPAPSNGTAAAPAAPRRPAEAPKTPAEPSPAGGIQSPNTACTASAVMPEDDYHRIKGLLTKWPHSATRVTERRNDNANNNARYRLSVTVDGEGAQERLKSAGFANVAISGNQAQLGTFNSEQQAERAASRARQAGFAPQIARVSNSGAEQSAALGESKMQLTFINVNNEAAAGISSVIGRYGSLRRAPCKQQP